MNIVWLDDLRATHRPEGQAARRCLRKSSAARRPQARRPGGDPVHLGLRRHAEGRGADPPQHPGQRRAGRLAHRLPFGRQGLQRPADLPFLRPDGGHGAAADRPACRSISIPRRCTTASCRNWSTARTRRSSSAPTRSSPAMRAPRTLTTSARCATASAGAEPVKASTRADLHGEVRPAHPRRLRRDRDRAGHLHQHADVQPLRHGRQNHAGHGVSAGAGAWRRRWRPALYPRPQRHGGLSARREARRARAAGRRLARHRRHRRCRRGRLRHHPRPRQALRQDRRRDDLAGRGRGAGRRIVERLAVGRRHRAGSRARARS